MDEFDVIIIGGGVMGGATALELARRGRKTALLEQFELGHSRGSSHGPNRIFRYSYPDPDYVTLVVEAEEDWRRLERDAGEPLVEQTGAVDLGTEAFECAEAMAKVGVEFEELTGSQVTDRFPLKLPSQVRAIYHSGAGVIAAQKTVERQLGLAESAGVTVHLNRKALSIENGDSTATVVTREGDLIAPTVVLTAGAWVGPLASTAGIDLDLQVTREQIAYILPAPKGLPVVIDRDLPVHYLVPQAFGAPGIKVGLHHEGDVVDPDDGPFEATDGGRAEVLAWVEDLTATTSHAVMTETCLYTNAPSEDFILKRVGRVVVVSACSGHGFKFAPRIGRVAADLVDGVDPGLPSRLISASQ